MSEPIPYSDRFPIGQEEHLILPRSSHLDQIDRPAWYSSIFDRFRPANDDLYDGPQRIRELAFDRKWQFLAIFLGALASGICLGLSLGMGIGGLPVLYTGIALASLILAALLYQTLTIIKIYRVVHNS